MGRGEVDGVNQGSAVPPEVERLPVIGVMGSGSWTQGTLAYDLGCALAGLNVHLLTGGGGGAMEEVSRGFASVTERVGRVIGILPAGETFDAGFSRPGYPNPFVEIPIRTHLPLSGDRGTHAMSRNHINVLTSDVIVALAGGAGTLSEIALAGNYRRPLIAYCRGDFEGLPDDVPVTNRQSEVMAFVSRHIRRRPLGKQAGEDDQ